MISFDDFKKVEITVGKILSAEKVQETDKLLKLSVDFGNNTNDEQDTKVRTETTPALADSSTPFAKGETTPAFADSGTPFAKGETTPAFADSGTPFAKGDIRQIVSGIASYFPDPQMLVGKKCMFVTNIPPRTIKGLESNGMILAVSTEDGKFSLLEPNAEIPEGTRAR